VGVKGEGVVVSFLDQTRIDDDGDGDGGGLVRLDADLRLAGRGPPGPGAAARAATFAARLAPLDFFLSSTSPKECRRCAPGITYKENKEKRKKRKFISVTSGTSESWKGRFRRRQRDVGCPRAALAGCGRR